MDYRKFSERFGSRILDVLFPRACVFCGEVNKLQDGVCDNCRTKIPVIEPPFCDKCGLNKKDCICKTQFLFYDVLIAPFLYEGVVRDGIQLFKFHEYDQNAAPYAHFMADAVRERFGKNPPFDLVVSVPLHPKDKRRRDYDHGALLAGGVAKELGLVYDDKVMVKLYRTQRQHNMSRFYRKGNLAGVFDVTDPQKVKGKRILLVDDVVTTGQSLNECAKMLYLHGAVSTVCLVLARTKPEKKEDKANDNTDGKEGETECLV